MKKIIGIIGVVVIAMTLFFNTSKANSINKTIDLADLTSLHEANAECYGATDWYMVWDDTCGSNHCYKGGKACCI